MNPMKFLPKGVSSKVGRQLLVGQKHAPVAMFVTGTAGMIGTVVLASRATLKLTEVLGEAESDLHKIETGSTIVGDEAYTEHDEKRDKTIVYTQTTLKIVKLYAPSVGLGLLSIGLLTGSHITLTRRNAGLLAAYGAMEKSLGEYRKRVGEEYGPEKERELYLGSQEQHENRLNKRPEGEKSDDPHKPWYAAPYSWIFNSNNSNWNPTPEYNFLFLRAQQNYLNDLLRTRGHVFLNDVLDALGFERTKEGAVVGWLRDGNGDGYIDFGIFNDQMNNDVLGFVVGREEAVALNFNVDGTVWDKI